MKTKTIFTWYIVPDEQEIIDWWYYISYPFKKLFGVDEE